MTTQVHSTDAAAPDAVRRRLNVVRIVSIVDFVLLVVLLSASFSNTESLIFPLGASHGIGFLVLLFLCARGAGERLWGWWFPAAVLVTGGPIGSLVGDVVVRRQIASA